MHIGPSRPQPDLVRIRAIKEVLRAQLGLTDADTLTVAELACLDSECAPIETVFGLMRPRAPQLQHRLHKPTSKVNFDDLADVCAAWRAALERSQGSDVHDVGQGSERDSA